MGRRLRRSGKAWASTIDLVDVFTPQPKTGFGSLIDLGTLDEVGQQLIGQRRTYYPVAWSWLVASPLEHVAESLPHPWPSRIGRHRAKLLPIGKTSATRSNPTPATRSSPGGPARVLLDLSYLLAVRADTDEATQYACEQFLNDIQDFVAEDTAQPWPDHPESYNFVQAGDRGEGKPDDQGKEAEGRQKVEQNAHDLNPRCQHSNCPPIGRRSERWLSGGT